MDLFSSPLYYLVFAILSGWRVYDILANGGSPTGLALCAFGCGMAMTSVFWMLDKREG